MKICSDYVESCRGRRRLPAWKLFHMERIALVLVAGKALCSRRQQVRGEREHLRMNVTRLPLAPLEINRPAIEAAWSSRLEPSRRKSR